MRMGGRSTKGWRSNLTLNREIVRGNRENGVYTNLAMLVPTTYCDHSVVAMERVKGERPLSGRNGEGKRGAITQWSQWRG